MKNFLSFILKIPILVLIISLLLTAVGLFNIITGAHNLSTYDELNRRAVTVEATVILDVPFKEADSDQQRHNYRYEFTLNGQRYEAHETTNVHHSVGSTVTIRVDSENPTKIVKNDGFTLLTSGIIVLAVGLFAILFSVITVKKTGQPMTFKDCITLLLLSAIVAFVAWGTCLIIDSQLLAGILLMSIGCPLFAVGTFMFRKFVK